jgi:DNA-binding Lrp family transcriptional regulator
MIRTLFREAHKPEPTEKIDQKGMVKWGDRNLYPQFLNSLYYNNPVHGGVINQKVKFITSGGLEVVGDASILENGNSAYNLDEVLEIIARDFEISDLYAVLFKKDLGTGIWRAEPLDFELIRATENLTFYDYSDDWSKSQQGEKTGFRKIKSIHHVDVENDTECILVNLTRPKQRLLENGTLTMNYYPEPNYSGAIVSILAGTEMDFFTFSEVVNGFKGGTLVALNNGIPESQHEADKIIKEIKGEATQKHTQGGMTVVFSDGKENTPTVEQLNGNDLDKRYIESNKEIVKKIMIAHGVISPALFSVLSESMFGSKEEMEVAYLIFKENYVATRQRNLLEPINWAFKKLNGFAGEIKYKDYMPTFLVAKEPVQEQMKAQFTDDSVERVISLFSERGQSIDEVKIIHSEAFDLTKSDDEIKDSFLKTTFADDLHDLDRKILRMIKDGESYTAIAKALDIKGVELTKRLVKLDKGGYINEWEVTRKGVQQVATVEELKVVYSYVKRPGVEGDTVIPTTRDFCRELIALNRVFTRSEIDEIGKLVDRDVWTYRGGWYHDPKADKTTPFCRHIWNQNIIVS